MASVVGVVCFAFSSEKSQHFSRFHTFYSRTGMDVGFLKVSCDFRQQFFEKTLSVSVSGRQKANIDRAFTPRPSVCHREYQAPY